MNSLILSWFFLSLNVQHDKTYRDTVYPFHDHSYILTVFVFDTESFQADQNNAVITFSRCLKNKRTVIFKDSVYSMHGTFEREDYNNDKVKDIAVFYYTGARANPTYHLYLVNNKKHTLQRVKGFEQLPNPSYDSVNHIICSYALTGMVYYSFYRINAQGKLINLGHAFDEEFGVESGKYDRAIRKIKKENKL